MPYTCEIIGYIVVPYTGPILLLDEVLLMKGGLLVTMLSHSINISTINQCPSLWELTQF